MVLVRCRIAHPANRTAHAPCANGLACAQSFILHGPRKPHPAYPRSGNLSLRPPTARKTRSLVTQHYTTISNGRLNCNHAGSTRLITAESGIQGAQVKLAIGQVLLDVLPPAAMLG